MNYPNRINTIGLVHTLGYNPVVNKNEYNVYINMERSGKQQ